MEEYITRVRQHRLGPKTPNLITIYVDGSYGHEPWYLRAEIYRSVHLVRTKKVQIDAGSRNNGNVCTVAPHLCGGVAIVPKANHVLAGLDIRDLHHIEHRRALP
jgi:hypothetical protein